MEMPDEVVAIEKSATEKELLNKQLADAMYISSGTIEERLAKKNEVKTLLETGKFTFGDFKVALAKSNANLAAWWRALKYLQKNCRNDQGIITEKIAKKIPELKYVSEPVLRKRAIQEWMKLRQDPSEKDQNTM